MVSLWGFGVSPGRVALLSDMANCEKVISGSRVERAKLQWQVFSLKSKQCPKPPILVSHWCQQESRFSRGVSWAVAALRGGGANGHSLLPAEQELGLLSPAFHRNNQPATMTPMIPSPENHRSQGHGSVLSAGMAPLRSECRWGDRGATGTPPAAGRSQQHQCRMIRSHPTQSVWLDPPTAQEYSAVAAVGQAGTLTATFPSKKGSDSRPISPLWPLLLFIFLMSPVQA